MNPSKFCQEVGDTQEDVAEADLFWLPILKNQVDLKINFKQ